MKLLLRSTFVFALIPATVVAQDSSVEIYLESLDGLRAAPAERSQPVPQPLLPAAPPALVEEQPQDYRAVSVPKPARKPVFNGTIIQPPPKSEKKRDEILQNAHDILERQGVSVAKVKPAVQPDPPSAPSEKEAEASETLATQLEEEAVAEEVKAPKESDSLPTSLNDIAQNLEVTLTFQAGVETLDQAQERILIEQVLPMLKLHENMRLTVVSRATSADALESEARRISLTRALAIQTFLVSHGIDKRAILPRPLGSSEGASDTAVLRVYSL